MDQVVFQPMRDSITEKNRIETQFNMKFCSNEQLFSVVYRPFKSPVENGCIYILTGPLKVLQSLKDGVLINLVEPMQYVPNKVLFVKTRKRYVDQELFGSTLVTSIGTFKHKNAFGNEMIVGAFQYLDDVTLSMRR